ncbi:MAG TPA: FAD-dependent oxidoreductase [Fimbriimonadaceae bacterium]|nr:FAD-dependent oxidoreductase [Fimbriimonadaceae bacterium]
MQTKAEAAIDFAEVHPPLTADGALFEAERCLQCGGPLAAAPCVSACPAEVDIPRFIREIKAGEPVEAGRTVFAANSLGGSCARVCPVDELCEGACVMGREGRRPVEIARLQRYAADAALASLRQGERSKPPARNGLSVGVVGAGPAGLACAEELACLGYEVTVYDRRALPGGLVTYAIAPYKQRIDPMFEEADRIGSLGVRVRLGIEIGRDVTAAEVRAKHDAIFLGIGMGSDQPAAIPAEDLPGIYDSLPFIQEVKLGKPEKLGLARKRVAVIGGGNTAIDVARELIRLGVKEATIVYRRDEASMPAYRHEIEAAKAEGVSFRFLAMPVRFLGKTEVTGIECLRVCLGEPDASGRAKPEAEPGTEFVVECDAVIKAIGQRPLQELLNLFEVEREDGRARIGPSYQTSNPQVFAGGDVVTGGATVVESVRQGKLAARGIDAQLRPAQSATPSAKPASSRVRVEHEGPFLKSYQGNFYVGTAPGLCKGCGLCVSSCPAQLLSLDEKSRITVQDMSQCVFCGFCEMRCPDFAIWIVKGEPAPAPVELEARRRLAL